MKFKFSILGGILIAAIDGGPEDGEDEESPKEDVIHDITGTTVYVVAVICVIPLAGLVAWLVRYAVKKRVSQT